MKLFMMYIRQNNRKSCSSLVSVDLSQKRLQGQFMPQRNFSLNLMKQVFDQQSSISNQSRIWGQRSKQEVDYILRFINYMFGTGRSGDDKQSSNSQLIPNSPTDSLKKKMFARKPAYALNAYVSEKRKKPQGFDQSCGAISLVNLHLNNSFKSIQLDKNLQTTAPNTNKDEFSKMGSMKQQKPFKRYREIFYSPKEEKNAPSTKGFLQRKSSKIIIENDRSEDLGFLLNNSYAFTAEKEKNNRLDVNPISQLLKNSKIKTSSVHSFLSNTKEKESSQMTVSRKSIAIQCDYCFNNKQKAQLLSQKYAKLQEQLNYKIKIIKQMTLKVDRLQKENQQLTYQLQKINKAIKRKDDEMINMQKQYFSKIQEFNIDVNKLTEKIKYYQVEKSMLLRFKDEYNLLTKQYDQIKYQNEHYKRQLISYISKTNGNGIKNQQHTPQTQKREPNQRGFSKKSDKNNPSIYFDCQDDNISLSFSQLSFDY